MQTSALIKLEEKVCCPTWSSPVLCTLAGACAALVGARTSVRRHKCLVCNKTNICTDELKEEVSCVVVSCRVHISGCLCFSQEAFIPRVQQSKHLLFGGEEASLLRCLLFECKEMKINKKGSVPVVLINCLFLL